jgi:hypothetical protein
MPLYETLKTILTDYPKAKNEPLAVGAFIRRWRVHESDAPPCHQSVGRRAPGFSAIEPIVASA